MNRTAFLLHTRTAVRVILFSTIGTGVVAAGGFAGVHYYIESRDPTPSTWPRPLRFAYRAAIFNNQYLEQPEAAKIGLASCLQYLHEEEADANVYPKALIQLAQIERRQGLLDAAQRHFSDALQAKEDLTPALISMASRQLGEIQECLGQTSNAQASFDTAISAFLTSHVPGSIPKLDGSVKHTPELIDAIKALVLSRARQGNYREALAALLSVLQYQRQHPAITSSSCTTASTMSNIAELVWALGDERECRRWNNEALSICTKDRNASDKYCLECAGISHNMLGLLSSRQGDKRAAQGHFTRALICAERADDANGLEEYTSNLHSAR